MRTYATAQLIGDRSHQCDATAVSTAPSGARAYALLDGIGSSDEIRDWTRTAARRLARTAARRGDAHPGRAFTRSKDRRAPSCKNADRDPSWPQSWRARKQTGHTFVSQTRHTAFTTRPADA